MSDTANLANSNIEPSMEDILSSIRKVIAEDLSQQEAGETQITAEAEPQTEITTPEIVEVDTIMPSQVDDAQVVDAQVTEQQISAEDHLDDILELDNLLGDIDGPDGGLDETMELIQLEGEMEEEPAAAQDEELEFEALTIPSPDLSGAIEDTLTDVESATAENPAGSGDSVDFDETLDLVMDSDASDYVTEKFTPVTDTTTPGNPGAASPYDGPKVDIIENLLFDELGDATGAADLDKTTQDPKLETAPESEQTREAIQASANDDMDLVKSLLEDLMDEPISETVSTSVETAVAEASFSVEDNFSEDDLLIPDPETSRVNADQVETIEQAIQTSPTVESEDIFETMTVETPTHLETEPENNIENELAQLAREIAEVRDAHTESTTATDDVVELSTPDYASKLAISASLTAGAAASEEEPRGIMAAAAESDLESLQQLIAETDFDDITPETPPTSETPKEIEMIQSPIQEPIKEEEAMAAPLKNDVLSDADTQQEVGNAFASLTNTVQEHALAEENGPPIGELVKEALRPMLQEWLDKNLKTMVQRAVTKEIKRISTGK